MRVLHVLGAKGDGGAELFFTNLVLALHARGLDQHCAIRAYAGREAALTQAGVPLTVLPFAGLLDPFTPVALGRLARRIGADVVLAWMSRAAAAVPRGPWVRLARLGGYYDVKYYRGYDGLIANTPDIARYLREAGWPGARVHVISNFAAVPPDAEALPRRDLDTPEDVPLLLSLGRLHPNKAFDVLLKALARLPEAHLWLAGQGPERDALQALADELGVAARVRWLGWRTDVARLLAAADLCVVSSRHEPLGNVVLEAWACGVPVVAAASAGPAWLIRDGRDGVLVPPDDPAALAAAVAHLIGDPQARDGLAAAGRQRHAGEFSVNAVTDRYLRLFEAASRQRTA